MHYFALLLTPERQLDADEGAREMQAYQDFHARAAAAIRAGDALAPAAAGVRISGGPDHPTVTDGPFAEGAEVAGGYYVFEADNLDDALELARQIPAADYGAIEVWPMVHWMAPSGPVGSDWMALLLEPADGVNIPDSPSGRPALRSTSSSARPQATGSSAAHPCTRRTPRPRSRCATGRRCSPTGRSPRVPRWPTASTCCGPSIATRPSSWRR